jgi:hypothetical protein
MLRKILNFGVALPHTVHNLYKIIPLFLTQNMHAIIFLRTWYIVKELKCLRIN